MPQQIFGGAVKISRWLWVDQLKPCAAIKSRRKKPHKILTKLRKLIAFVPISEASNWQLSSKFLLIISGSWTKKPEISWLHALALGGFRPVRHHHSINRLTVLGHGDFDLVQKDRRRFQARAISLNFAQGLAFACTVRADQYGDIWAFNFKWRLVRCTTSYKSQAFNP